MSSLAKELSSRAASLEAMNNSAAAAPVSSKKEGSGKARPKYFPVSISLAWPLWRSTILALLLPAILIAAWEISVRNRLIDLNLYSSPSQILSEVSKLIADGSLLQHLESTFLRVIVGFVAGMLAATFLGALTGFSRLSRELLDPLLQSLRSIPSMAWVPLFILWLGINESSKNRLKLQNHLMQIWQADQPTMLMVTHDVEEAVFFGDRVIVLGKDSGQIEEDYRIDLPRPRDRIAPQFQSWKETILKSLDPSLVKDANSVEEEKYACR